MTVPLLLTWLVVQGVAAPAKSPPTKPSAPSPTAQALRIPMVVSGDRFEVRGHQNQAEWTGHVKGVRGETTLTCERLIAHYVGQEISTVHGEGGVEVTDGDKWARGDQVDFDNMTGVAVVTGSPEARKGKNVMRGQRVTIDVTQDSLHVDQPITTFESNAGAAPKAGKKPSADPAFHDPVLITADDFMLVSEEKQATWKGRVKAVRGPTTLTCDRLVAHYDDAGEITRTVCIGNVQASDGDKWARGQRAEYFTATGFIVLTGSPEASQGPNRMRGTKVTIDLPNDTLRVENAVAVIETAPGARPTLPKKAPKGSKP